MTEEETYFNSIGKEIENAVPSKLFGKSCFKINNKAFTCFFENAMVFKLNGENHSEALALDHAELFDPSRKGRPMKEWVQVPYTHQEKWANFAQKAAAYIQEL